MPTPTLATDAVTAVIATILRTHRRLLDYSTPHGVVCLCGHHYPDTDAWDHHRAAIITDTVMGALDYLDPTPPPPPHEG